ncbi:MAG: FAD-dependent oxidoreductase [Oscillospiraceae bacterium]|nr:FAD-dependent oxidoreductase [Oscillospiraceae bacterium]
MSERYKNLMEPLVLRNKVLKSRFIYPVAQPHFLQANELYPSDPIVAYYTNRCKNGVALILLHDLTELTQRYGFADTGHFAMYDIDDKGCQNGFTQFAEYIHYYGSMVCPELNIDNRMPLQINDPNEDAGPNPFLVMMQGMGGPEDEDNLPPGPPMMPGAGGDEPDPIESLIDGAPGMPKPHKLPEGVMKAGAPGAPMAGARQITGDLFEYYIQATIKHAKTYQSLNYDGGYLCLAKHNFMIGKFLCPKENRRTDEYGGSLENRMRFPVELIRRIREAMGEDWLFGIECPAVEEDGFTLEECVTFLKTVEPYVDFMQLRVMHPDHQPYQVCESAELSAKIKAMGVNIPTFVSTYYKDLDSLNKIIADGKVEGVAPGHLMICNENMGEILRNGNGEDLNPCIECHCCRGTSSTGDWMSHCTINPLIGMEHQAFRFVEPVTRQKKVAVIGGGPGGMKCAMWLKERGHTPVIFEATDELGGQIKSANFPTFKWELKRYLDFLKNQMVRKEIEVRLNTTATPEMIRAEGFDSVVVAVGASPKLPPVEGAETAKWNGVSIYGNVDKIGKNVVVIGGASTAAEAACYLAENGKNVTEICRQGRIAYDLNPIRSIGYMNSLAVKLGVKVKKNAQTLKIEPGKVTFRNAHGIERVLECDDVVVTGGFAPNAAAAIAFAQAAPEFYMIGDCRQPGTMRHAIRDAYAVAMQI